MTVASLSKLTVPLPAGQSASNQGLMMPKLKYRFRVTLLNFGVTAPSTEITKQVTDCTRPEVEFDEIVLDVYNSRIKLNGKHKWSDITLKVRDTADGVVSRLVGEQIQKQFDFQEQASAAAGIDYKFIMQIEILDGGNGAYAPNTLEMFECYGCVLKKATYQGGDYKAGTEVMDIALAISIDNAIQYDSTGNSVGIGQSVGRANGTLATG
jgi:hypothetical protein